MRSRLAAQQGFSLVELLLVSALFIVILTATVASMSTFERLNADNRRSDDQVERTRRAVERGARQLRNLASRPATGAATIARAEPFDFIFQTSDPTRTWQRFCTQPKAGGKVWLWSLASAAAAPPPGTGCPGPAGSWARRDPVATSVTNLLPGRSEPMFTYGRTCPPPAAAACPTSLTSITSVHMEVLLDENLRRDPVEVRVGTGVYLRNQNEMPSAKFTVHAAAISRTALLNASGSSDPEGRTLRYYWFRTDDYEPFACGSQPKDGTVLGQGVTLHYLFPAADGPAGTRKNITLVVCDPGSLQATYAADVAVPS